VADNHLDDRPLPGESDSEPNCDGFADSDSKRFTNSDSHRATDAFADSDRDSFADRDSERFTKCDALQ
jgi:hypothetical protein